jgi:hypothetical protein
LGRETPKVPSAREKVTPTRITREGSEESSMRISTAAFGKGSPRGVYTIPVINKNESQAKVTSAVTIPEQINWQPVKHNLDNILSPP